MADIRINQLPLTVSPVPGDFVPLDNGSTRRTTIENLVLIGRPTASQPEAEAGTNPTKAMTPLTTKQAVTFYGLLKENNLNDLASAPAARTNLGLGGAAILNVGTTAGTVAAGDDSRIVNAVQTSRTLTAGTGLTGGGDLSANRTIALNAASIASLAKADSALQPLTRIQTRSDIIRGDSIGDPLWASRIGDFDNGERGSLFIWNDPANADLIAGYNAGMQVWIGDNPTATPGVGHAVASTLAVVNGNGRNALYGQNILVGLSSGGAGYVDGFLCGMEINVYADFAATVTDAYAGGNRKNGLELTSQGSVGRLTAAAAIWSADNTGAAWWSEGIAVSRAVNNGIRFTNDPGGSADGINAFQNAAILDESLSVSVLKIANTHTDAVRFASGSTVTNLINLQDGPTLTNFVLGRNNANTSLLFSNGVNFGFDLTVNSGNSSAQNASITLADRGTGKWQLIKNNGNDFGIFNVATALSSISISTSTDAVSTARNLFVGGGGNPLGLSRVLSVSASSGTAGIDLQLAGSSKLAMTTDGSTYGQVLTVGTYDLLLGTNSAEKLRIKNTPGNGLGLKMAVPANSYANDAAAAVAGVAVGEFYRNGSAIQIRVA